MITDFGHVIWCLADTGPGENLTKIRDSYMPRFAMALKSKLALHAMSCIFLVMLLNAAGRELRAFIEKNSQAVYISFYPKIGYVTAVFNFSQTLTRICHGLNYFQSTVILRPDSPPER
jgi:hypothetical protein